MGTRPFVVHNVLSLVDAQDNGLGVVLGGGRVYDLLGATVNDGLGHLFGKEHTSGLTT